MSGYRARMIDGVPSQDALDRMVGQPAPGGIITAARVVDGWVEVDVAADPLPAALTPPRLYVAPVGTAPDGEGWQEVGTLVPGSLRLVGDDGKVSLTVVVLVLLLLSALVGTGTVLGLLGDTAQSWLNVAEDAAGELSS